MPKTLEERIADLEAWRQVCEPIQKQICVQEEQLLDACYQLGRLVAGGFLLEDGHVQSINPSDIPTMINIMQAKIRSVAGYIMKLRACIPPESA